MPPALRTRRRCPPGLSQPVVAQGRRLWLTPQLDVRGDVTSREPWADGQVRLRAATFLARLRPKVARIQPFAQLFAGAYPLTLRTCRRGRCGAAGGIRRGATLFFVGFLAWNPECSALDRLRRPLHPGRALRVGILEKHPERRHRECGDAPDDAAPPFVDDEIPNYHDRKARRARPDPVSAKAASPYTPEGPVLWRRKASLAAILPLPL